jgi:hypothetical protein
MKHGSAALAVLTSERAARGSRAIEGAVRSAHQCARSIASETSSQRVEERIQGAQFTAQRQLEDSPAPECPAAGGAEEPAAGGNQVRRAAPRSGT